MLTDYEAVLQDLKVQLQTKDSHGRRELLTIIGELEVKHQVDEGVIERAFRVRGNKLSQDLLHYPGQDPDTLVADGAEGNGTKAALS